MLLLLTPFRRRKGRVSTMEEHDGPVGKPTSVDRRGFLKLTGGVAGVLLAKSALPQAPVATASGLAVAGLSEPGSLAAAATGVKHFYIYATDGYLLLPDGTQVYLRGFTGNNPPTTPAPNPTALLGKAQLPAPVIECVEDYDCYIHFQEIGNVNRRAPV